MQENGTDARGKLHYLATVFSSTANQTHGLQALVNGGVWLKKFATTWQQSLHGVRVSRPTLRPAVIRIRCPSKVWSPPPLPAITTGNTPMCNNTIQDVVREALSCCYRKYCIVLAILMRNVRAAHYIAIKAMHSVSYCRSWLLILLQKFGENC